jgi:hypothetical protein
VTWSTVAIDARRRRRFIHDFRLGTPVQAPGAQLPHRRVDVIGALDMMTVQVGLDHALRGCTGIFRVASGGRENAREKVAQAVDRDRDRFRGVMLARSDPLLVSDEELSSTRQRRALSRE